MTKHADTSAATTTITATTTTSQPATTASTTPVVPALFSSLPKDGHSPAPPAGFEKPTGANYRGVLPRGTELIAAPNALQDLQRFAATYAATLGATAPPFEHLVEGLTAASGWTGLRIESSAWDDYCLTQEGMAWQALRPLLDKLVTAFGLAADSNKALVSEYPSLAVLLGAKAQIAQKAVSTKRLNKKAVAEGKQPFHGAVGKKRQRQAQKAAYDDAGSAPATSAAQPATSAQPATPTAASGTSGTH